MQGRARIVRFGAGLRPVAAAHAAAVPCRISFGRYGLSRDLPRGMGPVALNVGAPDELDESAGCTCTSA
jgi:hypothetical protein